MQLTTGLNLLKAIGRGSGRSILMLNLWDYFQVNLNIASQVGFLLAMRTMVQLRNLSLNYNYMSDELLKILTRHCSHSLKYIVIKIVGYNLPHHRIDRDQWKHLHSACPQITVAMSFEELQEYDSIKNIAVSEAKLNMISLNVGWQFTPEEGVNNLLKHLGNTFFNSLTALNLDFEYSSEAVDEGILYMVNRCRLLETLYLQAVMMVSTAKEICQMQLDKKLNLVNCGIMIENVRVSQMEELETAIGMYTKLMKETGVNFLLTGAAKLL